MQTFFPFAIYNTAIVSTEKLPIPHGYQGIFSTIKVVNSLPLFLEQHLIRLGVEEKKDFFNEQIEKLLDKNQCLSAAVRVIVLANGTSYFHARNLPQKSNMLTAITIQSNQKLPTIKQIDRSLYEAAQASAQKSHAQEAIFVEGNILLETTIANIISQDEKGNLITPKLTKQGLKGIMRQVLLSKGYVQEADISIDTKYPLVAINCLRVMGIKKLNNSLCTNPVTLMQQVKKILDKEEKIYADSYYR